MRQKGLTVITEISPEKTASLRELLESIGNAIDDNSIIHFNSLKTVHFLRWVILEESEVFGVKTSPKLVLSTNYDGSLDYHLKDLCMNALEGLIKIYSYCENVPKTTDPNLFASYLKKHSKPIAAFYRGTVGRQVEQIHKEQFLWKKSQDFLQEHPIPDDPISAKEVISNHLKKDKALKWALSPYSREFTQQHGLITLVLLVTTILGGIITSCLYFTLPSFILLGGIFLFILVWWCMLRTQEKKDEAAFIATHKDPSQVAMLTKKEDYKVQNQLTHLVDIKPGIVRLYTLHFVLWAINLLAKFVFNKGSLGGIQSIHYARWVIIDGGKRLLFFSNYDGSWESYLGEFVDRASVGLTGVWSNTVGFPPTKNLIRNGAKHSAEFKAWAREKQIPTQVWYSAYPTSSTKNINNNTAIRQGLIQKMNLKNTQTWLQRL